MQVPNVLNGLNNFIFVRMFQLNTYDGHMGLEGVPTKLRIYSPATVIFHHHNETYKFIDFPGSRDSKDTFFSKYSMHAV